MRRIVWIVAVLLLGLTQCSGSEFVREDFGLGVSLKSPTDRFSSQRQKIQEMFPTATGVGGYGSFRVFDEKLDFSISASDYNSDYRMDRVALRYRVYEESTSSPEGYKLWREIQEGKRRRAEKLEVLSAERLEKFAQGFAEKAPGIKTKRGVTLGSTKAEVQSAYGALPTIALEKGIRSVMAYRSGNSYIVFVLLRGRVVEISAILPPYKDEEFIKDISGWRLEVEVKKSIFKE